MKTIRAAVIQTVSGADIAENTERVAALVAEAAQRGAQWVVLPEYWPLMGMHEKDKIAAAEPPGNGPLQDFLSSLAAQRNITLFGGTIPLKSPEPGKVLNSMLTFGPDGTQIGRYDKIHLFGFTGIGEHYAEADTITPGTQIPTLTADGISVAQGICYDLRFPELFRAQLPFDILVLPAAFTYTTGRDHWEILLRARAIENQCFVLAAAQGGIHTNGRHTFGHSMIVDPWGKITAEAGEGEGIIMADLEQDILKNIRLKLSALRDKKQRLFQA